MTPSPNFSTSESLVMHTQIFCFIAWLSDQNEPKITKNKNSFFLQFFNESDELMSQSFKNVPLAPKLYNFVRTYFRYETDALYITLPIECAK